jgi:hypothetical protein
MQIGNFPLRSSKSRAAARALLDKRRLNEGEGTLIRIRLVGSADDPSSPDDPSRKCTCRTPKAGEVVVCWCFT